MHNCWSKCSTTRLPMLAAIPAFAGMVPSKTGRSELGYQHGVGAHRRHDCERANRFDANVIAKYEFETGRV